jgi:hypothetical protein
LVAQHPIANVRSYDGDVQLSAKRLSRPNDFRPNDAAPFIVERLKFGAIFFATFKKKEREKEKLLTRSSLGKLFRVCNSHLCVIS